MLSKLRIVNFRSIADLTIDFSYAEGKAPNGYKDLDTLPFLTAPDNSRLVPCMSFFGANASGKSNIIRAVWTLTQLLRGHNCTRCFDPNVLCPTPPATTLEVCFFYEDNAYQYTITYDGAEIVEEKLVCANVPLFTINKLMPTFSKISTDAYPVEKLTEILKVESSNGKDMQTKSFLSCIGRGYRGLNEKLTEAYDFFESKLLVLSNKRDHPLPEAVDVFSEKANIGEDQALRKIVEFVQRLDIDIHNIQITQREPSEDERKRIEKRNPSAMEWPLLISEIYSVHKTSSGELIARPFEEMESDGTIRLAGLAGFLLAALQTGTTLFIDEIDCSLHPTLVRELVKMVKDKRHNKTKETQLFFATHTTDLLEDELLRVSEVALVRKSAQSGTMVRRLVDLKKDDGESDIRNVTNFRKQYLHGYYSGIPHPAV